jgi:hypothetical protein
LASLIVFGARAGKSEAKRWPVGGEKVRVKRVGWWHRARGFPGGARDLPLPLRLGAADAELVGGALTSFPWFIARFFFLYKIVGVVFSMEFVIRI